MTTQERILEINRLLNEAEDLEIETPGLLQELAELEGEPTVEALPEGGETPSQEYHRVMAMRYPATFGSWSEENTSI